MATIKNFTDLSQSKKLAEILATESADMHWQYIEEDNGQLQWFCFPKDFSINENESIPAWSLAALLELIPNWTMDKTDKINLMCNPYDHCEACYKNPIDAAFEMVCWLKENEKI